MYTLYISNSFYFTIINQSDSVIGCGFFVHRVGVCIKYRKKREKKNTHPYTFQCSICIHNATTTTTNSKIASKRYCVCNGEKKRQKRKEMCMQCAHVSTQTLKNQRFFVSAVFMRRSIFFSLLQNLPLPVKGSFALFSISPRYTNSVI